MHLVCRAEARHIHKVHHEFKARRVAGPMCRWHHAHSRGESIESFFLWWRWWSRWIVDECSSGNPSATEASQAPMGLAAIYCHPLEFFLSDLMCFPQTITAPSTTATSRSFDNFLSQRPLQQRSPMKLWRTDCWTGWISSQAECKGPHNPIQPIGEGCFGIICYNWGRLRWQLALFFQFLRPLGAGLVAVRTNGFTGVGLSVGQKQVILSTGWKNTTLVVQRNHCRKI